MTNLKSDLKLLISLVVWMLIPSIYLLVRMNIVSVNNVDINILGQMEWFDLIDEVITTILIVPLYSLLSKVKSKYKNGIAFLTSFLIYLLFTIMIVFVLFKNGAFKMNMNFIIYMFGGGMVVHMVLSIIIYYIDIKRISI